MSELQEKVWIDAARDGDPLAFEQLIHRYEKRVFALTRRMCKNPADAEEAAQEAFLAAWQGLKFFRGESSFSTWLYRLAVNASIDLLRREKRHRGAASLEDEETPDIPDRSLTTPQDEAERRELQEQIRAGLQELSEEHRQVLVLREMDQLSYQEISDILDLDVGTVKSRIARARDKLRKYLLQSGNFSGYLPSNLAEKEG